MQNMSALPRFADGQVVNAAALTNVSTNLDTLCRQSTGFAASAGASSKPVCKLTRATTQSIPSGAATAISWSSALVDTSGMWSSSSPTRLTVQVPGWYELIFYVAWASTRTVLSAAITVNATVAAQRDQNMGGTNNVQMQTRLYDHLTAGTVLTATVTQSSGASLSTHPFGGGLWLAAIWNAPF